VSKRGRVEHEQPRPFPPEMLEAMRKAHRPSDNDSIGGNEVCNECYRLWPCNTSRLLATIDSMVPWDHSDEDSVNGTLDIEELVRLGTVERKGDGPFVVDPPKGPRPVPPVMPPRD